jgi:hypothetical protein
MIIPMTLAFLRPNEEWTLDGDDYSGLTWVSNTTKPTQAELAAAWPKAQAAAESAAATAAANAAAAIAHAKSLGFTDAMISAMYPALITQAP